MKLLMAGALALSLSLSTVASARGGGHGGGSVHVSGYTRANGTYVHDYYRSAPDTAGSGGAGSSIPSTNAITAHESLDLNGGGQGTSSPSIGQSWQSSRPGCEFKAVMTDEEIARCR